MLDIHKYLQPFSMWVGIRQYILEHCHHFSGSSSTLDHDIFKYLTSRATLLFENQQEADNFRKGLDNLKKDKTNVLKRDNQYRLCFALQLSHTEANILLLDYLHVNELSARNLTEFIIICGLKCQIKWGRICEILEDFSEERKNIPLAPNDLKDNDESITDYFIADTVNALIHSEDDLLRYLSNPANLSFFAKTRNTHYKALFYDVPFSVKNGKVILLDDSNINENLITGTSISVKLKMTQYYRRLFHMYATERETVTNYLTDDEVNKLVEIYPETFMTYNTFRNLVQLKRPIDISSGTFLLHLLLTADPVDIMFNDPEEFKSVLNSSLDLARFPSLNQNHGFDSLILDVYEETIRNYNTSDSESIKLEFLSRLRTYLKEIAKSRM